MTNFRPLVQKLALAGLLALSMGGGVQPALAAKADVDLLKSYVGKWSGRGVMVGQGTETVVCNLTLSEGNSDKVNYTGRCALAGTTLSVNGTLAFNDGNKRFEAAMTSNVGFSGLAVGRKQGEALVFNLRERNKDDAGNDLNVTAAITLRKEKIQVDFQVVFVANGGTIKAQIPLTK